MELMMMTRDFGCRERQCDLGKQSARADRECSVTRDQGGEFHKDCCEGCKLGLVAGSMSASCSLRVFQFGPPWDEAYFTCCQQARPQVLEFHSIHFRKISLQSFGD